MADGYLEHHGILGMKWGVRRYQNADGSYTPAGERRYFKKASKQIRDEGHFDIPQNKKAEKDLKRIAKKSKTFDEFDRKTISKYGDMPGDMIYDRMEGLAYKDRQRSDRIKRGAKIAAGVLATAATAYVLHKTGADKKIFDAGKKIVSRNMNTQLPKKEPSAATKAVLAANKAYNQQSKSITTKTKARKLPPKQTAKSVPKINYEAILKEGYTVPMANARKANRNLDNMAERFINMNANMVIR